MELDIPALMLIFFIIFLVISIWKIYAFLPNKELADDDTTEESKKDLTDIMIKVIKSSEGNLSIDELFVKFEECEDFDAERYWRFNKNRLNQLLHAYYLEHPHISNIKGIHKYI